MNTLDRLGILGFLAVAASVSAGLAAPPAIDIPASNAQSGMDDSHRKQIDAYVQHCVKAMAEADSPEQVVEARKLLAEGYNRYGTKAAEYQFAFAKAVADQGAAALAAKMPGREDLANLKEVNLAAAVGRMAQASLQPLTDAMVVHGNPAVRYFGWSAYATLRAPLLAYGDRTSKAMYDRLGKGLAEEKDALVLAELVSMFRMPREPDPDSGVSQAAYRAGQEKFLEVLGKHWDGLCLAVMGGDAATCEAGFVGAASLGMLTEAVGAGADKKASLQMILNMAYAAGKAFDRALQLREAAVAAKDAPDSPETRNVARKFGVTAKELPNMVTVADHAISGSSLLLEECERLLNKLTDRGDPGDQHIGGPLRKQAAAGDRGAAVQLGVLRWVDELTKSQGVKHPRDVLEAAAAAATQPATAPAKAP